LSMGWRPALAREPQRGVSVPMSTNEPTKVEPTQVSLSAESASTNGDFEIDVEETPGTARYQVGEEIARGGIGRVISAYDRILEREIAVKLLQNRFRDDPTARRRFQNEARIIARLQHPGIAPIYEVLRGSSDHWLISMPLRSHAKDHHVPGIQNRRVFPRMAQPHDRRHLGLEPGNQ